MVQIFLVMGKKTRHPMHVRVNLLTSLILNIDKARDIQLQDLFYYNSQPARYRYDWPLLYVQEVLYERGQDFLDIQYSTHKECQMRFKEHKKHVVLCRDNGIFFCLHKNTFAIHKFFLDIFFKPPKIVTNKRKNMS